MIRPRSLRSPQTPGTVCCLCLYVKPGRARPVLTIIRGFAVCELHIGYAAQGTEWHAMYGAAK